MLRVFDGRIGRVVRLTCAWAGVTLAGIGCSDETGGPAAPEDPVQPTLATAAGALSFRQISTGSGHACGVTTDDRAYCWGSNDEAILGVGDTPLDENDISLRPIAVRGGLHFRFVSASGSFTCGLTTDDLAYCWGFNGLAQLGDGSRTVRSTPVPVAGGRRFRQLRSGNAHTCAVTYSDTAFCWGDNSHGQLGDGTTHGPLKPVRVAGGLSFRRVFAAVTHTCGALAGGKTYCWGDNTYSQLGDGSTTQRLTPVAVKGGLFFSQLSTGKFATCGVANSRAYCWGRNRYGALGDGTFTRRPTPNPVASSLQFAGVSAGREAACGVTTGHLAYCWGYNHSGRLGDGTDVLVPLTPVAVVGGLQFASVSTSLDWFFTCGVTTGNRAYCWGSNFVGQLGIGNYTPDYSLSPVPVVGP
jgi:alpha-tubulin suppressor-like RCC1 family protein